VPETNDMMQQLREIWSKLSLGQKTGAVVICIAVFGGILIVTTMAGDPEYRQLVSDLSPKELEAVVSRFSADGIQKYKIIGMGTILVDIDELEDARRSLAQGGLLGASSDDTAEEGLFGGTALNSRDLSLREARKAERRLEKILVGTFEFVDHAKITITPAVRSYYKSGKKPAKAAVVVKSRGVLGRNQIESIANTVASAVENLSPDNIAISDTRGVLLRSPRVGSGKGNDGDRGADLEYQTQLEAQKTLQAQDLMDRSFGPGKIRVQVSVNLDWKRQQIKKMEFDPDSAVTVDREKMEKKTQRPSRAPGGAPGNSALNNGSNSTSAALGRDESSTVKESKKFNTTESQIVEMGGRILRMTVSAIVDESLKDQVSQIGKVIANAVGLDEKGRGDTIEIIATKLEIPEIEDITESIEAAEKQEKIMAWAQIGIYAFLGLAFLFFSLRTIKRAQASLKEVLESSMDEEKEEEPVAPPTLEEQILEKAKRDSELAGRTLRRWLYEGAEA